MELDIKKAFLSPFSDKRWHLKLIFPCVTMTILLIIFDSLINVSEIVGYIIAPICFIAVIFILGFFVIFIHNEISNNKPLLPGIEVKLKDYFICGLISMGIFLIYSTPDYFLGLINHIPATATYNTFTRVSLYLLSLILSIICAFSINSYADSFHLKDAIRFKCIFKLMFKVKLEILIYLVLSFILNNLASPLGLGYIAAARHLHFTTIAFAISKDITIPMVGNVFTLIFFNLQAQIYKIAKKRLEDKEIAIPEADLQHQTFDANN